MEAAEKVGVNKSINSNESFHSNALDAENDSPDAEEWRLTEEGYIIRMWRRQGFGHQFIVETGSGRYELWSGSEVGENKEEYLDTVKELEELDPTDKRYSKTKKDDTHRYRGVRGVAKGKPNPKRRPISFALTGWGSGDETDEETWMARGWLSKVKSAKTVNRDIERHEASVAIKKADAAANVEPTNMSTPTQTAAVDGLSEGVANLGKAPNQLPSKETPAEGLSAAHMGELMKSILPQMLPELVSQFAPALQALAANPQQTATTPAGQPAKI